MHGMVRQAWTSSLAFLSDPMADGPVIQKAGERAIANGVNLAKVLGYVREFRPENSTPRGADGLRQPRRALDDLQHGAGAFVRDAAAAGLDGMLVVDYPA